MGITTAVISGDGAFCYAKVRITRFKGRFTPDGAGSVEFDSPALLVVVDFAAIQRWNGDRRRIRPTCWIVGGVPVAG